MRLYEDVQPTVSCGGGKAGQGNNMVLQYNPVYHYIVRRLTPRECERLQGFPDDWTLIPWRGKSAEDCPDTLEAKTALPPGLSAFFRLIKSTLNRSEVPVRCC